MKKRKVNLKFVLILLSACVLVGSVLGVLLAILEEGHGPIVQPVQLGLQHVGQWLMQVLSVVRANIVVALLSVLQLLQDVAVWLMLVVGVVLDTLAIIYRKKVKKEVSTVVEGEDEDKAAFRAAEDYFARGLMVNEVFFALVVLLFSITASGFGTAHNIGVVLLALFLLCVFLGVGVVEQGKLMSTINPLYPERPSNFTDKDFEKKLYESYSEDEKRQIGDAAQVAVKTTNKAVLLLFIVLILLSMVMDVGVLPILTLGTIYLVQVISYHRAAIKWEEKQKK